MRSVLVKIKIGALIYNENTWFGALSKFVGGVWMKPWEAYVFKDEKFVIVQINLKESFDKALK